MDMTSLSLWPKKMQLMLGTFVHSEARDVLKFLFKAAIAVDELGKIAGVEVACEDVNVAKMRLLERMGWNEDEVDIYACKPGQFFFPGFIDTHVHASQYPIVGVFGESTLLEWLQKYVFPTEDKLKVCDTAGMVYRACIRRTLAHGTTTAAYYSTIHVPSTMLLADLCFEFGQRAFIGRVCMDNQEFCPSYLRDETSKESLDRTREVITHIRDIDPNFEVISPILTPRFAPACSPEVMIGLANMHHEYGLPIQTHISENTAEVELVAKMFPDSGSYAKVYDNHGLLTPKTILGHAVHLTAGEAALISARKSKVAHCPCSNSALTSGEARVRWLWDQGIDVGLGTDMSGGYSPSILEAARQAVLVSRHLAMGGGERRSELTVAEVLYLGTRGGAKVVGLENKIGGFEVGKDWDAQLVGLHIAGDGGENGEGNQQNTKQDSGNVDLFEWDTWDRVIAKWVYNGDDRNTKKVWVKGRLVHSRS